MDRVRAIKREMSIPHEPAAAAVQDRLAPHSARSVLHPAVGRELLDTARLFRQIVGLIEPLAGPPREHEPLGVKGMKSAWWTPLLEQTSVHIGNPGLSVSVGGVPLAYAVSEKNTDESQRPRHSRPLEACHGGRIFSGQAAGERGA